MYKVVWYKDHTDKTGIVMHEPLNYGNKLTVGDLDLSLEGIGIGTFRAVLTPKNTLYNKVEQINNLVDVFDVSETKVFSGRLGKIHNKMTNGGSFHQELLFEDKKSYLYDSVQEYMKPTLMKVSAYLGKMLDVHNSQVEWHKRILLGMVTVEDDEPVYRGLGYGKTMDLIKDKLLDRLGGYLILREVNGTLYLDYLKEYGKVSDTPIQVTRNLKQAEREADVEELATVIVPLGAEIETSDEHDIGTDFSRPKVDIKSVNDGKNYLVDKDLKEKYGTIALSVEFPNVTDKNILKTKGQNYLRQQRLMLVTWNVEVIELGLLDPKYELFHLGNIYPVENPVMYGRETLQVIGKKVNILKPQIIDLTVGSGKKTLSQYQLEYAGLQRTLNEVTSNLISSNKKLSDMKIEAQKLKEEAEALKQSNQEAFDKLNQTIKELEEKIRELEGGGTTGPVGKIIDISEWQGVVDFNALKADGVELVIIRVQHGSSYQDMKYMENIQKCLIAGIRYAVYAYCAFTSDADARAEATDFYNRTQQVVSGKTQPVFYMADVEEQTASNMRSATTAFNEQLVSLGVPKQNQVVYIAHHLYPTFNIDTSQFGSVVLPSYGVNDGTVAGSTEPLYPYDLWQYTSTGSVAGISGNVDLNTNPSERFKKQYLGR